MSPAQTTFALEMLDEETLGCTVSLEIRVWLAGVTLVIIRGNQILSYMYWLVPARGFYNAALSKILFTEWLEITIFWETGVHLILPVGYSTRRLVLFYCNSLLSFVVRAHFPLSFQMSYGRFLCFFIDTFHFWVCSPRMIDFTSVAFYFVGFCLLSVSLL